MIEDLELVGGPYDGERRPAPKSGAGLLMIPLERESPRTMFIRPNKHTVAHAYAIDYETRKAYYLGRKSQHELKAEHGGYNPQDRDDADDADWWKK